MDVAVSLQHFFEEMKLNNVSATTIAKELNISKSTLSNYTNGDAYIPLEHLNKLANIYGFSVDYILRFTKLTNYEFARKIENLDSSVVGYRLKMTRKMLKVTQEDLAKIIGTNKSSISRYENGKNMILTIALYTFCKTYKISCDYILGRTDNPKTLKDIPKII